MKIAIIGAGISGVSAGRMLQDQGHDVVLYEKHDRPGGLVRCEWVDGNLFHKVGGHVFNSKIPEVLDWFWKHFDKDKEFIPARRNAKILLDGQVIGYPIENYLYQLEPDVAQKIIGEIMDLHSHGYKDPFSYPHFEAFLRGNFGDTLYDLYFGPYNGKIWNTDLSTVALEWLEGKLPMPDYTAVITSNIIRKEESDMVHSTFFYPKKGGSQFIIDRLAEGLDIRTNAAVKELKYDGRSWTVNAEEKYEAIVYTGDVRMLPKILDSTITQFPNSTVHALSRLRSNGTSNAFCYCDDTGISWLYLPGPETLAHRIIYTGNFSPENNAPAGRNTCVVEFSGFVEEDTMRREFAKCRVIWSFSLPITKQTATLCRIRIQGLWSGKQRNYLSP